MHNGLAPLFFPDGLPAGVDPSDPAGSAEAALTAAAATAQSGGSMGLRRALAEQLLVGEPPELEAAALRLLEVERTPREVWNELELAMLDAAVGDDGAVMSDDAQGLAVRSPGETDRHLRANLDLLPLPGIETVVDTYLELAGRPIPLDDLDQAVARRLALDLDVSLVRRHLESVQDELISKEFLVLVGDDLAVDPEQILHGLVLTTRVGRRRDRLVLDADLAAFSFLDEPDQTVDGQPVDVEPDFERRTVWYGPSDWLAEFAEDEVVCVWVDEGVVHLDRVSGEAASLDRHEELVGLLRERFQAEVAEAGLPLSARELVVVLRAADPRAFGRPSPPFTELCRAAGLEVRGQWVASDAQQWARQRWGGLLHRTFDEFEEPERERVDPLVLLHGKLIDGEEPEPAGIRAALASLADPLLTLDLLRLLFGAEEEPEAAAELARLVDVLRPAATRARQRAAVAWLGSRVAARQGNPDRAESLLRDVLVDDPDNADAMDELAWYRSDRGDAEGARSLWRRLEGPPADDLAALPEPGSAGPKLRRNEPCWCGSGRKYKACHLRLGDRPPLPERFGWVLQKPISFLFRRSGRAVIDLAEAAAIVADGDREAMARAWGDPLVVDVVLAEFGWLQRFLDERGALLPDDERLLVTSWLLAERTVVEVVSADGPAGLIRMRDLRTGDEHEVLDRTFAPISRRAQLLCTRLLDDGERKRLAPGVFEVPPGREGGLLSLLDLDDRGSAARRRCSGPRRLRRRRACRPARASRCCSAGCGSVRSTRTRRRRCSTRCSRWSTTTAGTSRTSSRPARWWSAGRSRSRAARYWSRRTAPRVPTG